MTSGRELVCNSSSRTVPPLEERESVSLVLTSIAAIPGCLVQSTLASHSGSGGNSGNVSSSWYKQLFWLLDPAFSTNIFIKKDFSGENPVPCGHRGGALT